MGSYPDDDLQAVLVPDGRWRFTHKDGTPYDAAAAGGVVLQHGADVELGGAYEGPAGLVHGGMLAAVFDQALGRACENAKVPGMTGTLSIRYRQGTKLGKVHVEAWLDRIEGVKAFAKAEVSTSDGVCAEAEGVFIMPKWARGLLTEKLLGTIGD